MYPEATLHGAETKFQMFTMLTLLGNVSNCITVSAILIFPVTVYQVQYGCSELCNKLENIHWDTYANTNS